MTNTTKSNMKKGITLIEIILAIVLIAIILGLTIPKLMKNSQNAEIKQTISSDVKAIVEAAVLWRKSSAGANNNFRTLNNNALNSRLPNGMVIINTGAAGERITSAGLKTGGAPADSSGIEYFITWQFDTVAHATESGNFSLGADFTKGNTDLQWDGKTFAYATDAFTDTVTSINNATVLNSNQAHIVSFSSGAPTINCADAANVVCRGNISVQ